MYRKILVPVDGSTFAESALPYALSIARRASSGIELVTVEEPDRTLSHDELGTAAREWSRSYLDETTGRIRPFAPAVTATQTTGRVADALVKRASEADADLVVMATHGRGAVSRTWLGSATDAFVRHTDRPVLLVTPRDDGEQLSPEADVELDHILIPLDGSDFSLSVLEPAVALGSLFGARYTLLRVVAAPATLTSADLPQPPQASREAVEVARAAALEQVDAIARELRARGLRGEAEVMLESTPAKAILHRAAELDCSVIALATHGRGGVLRAILGSTTDKVIRVARRPVLVLRPDTA